MNKITWSNFIHKGAYKAEETLPAEITVEGETKFIICKEEDVIVVSDLHIRVRNQLKAQEKKARGGMAKPTKITTEMLV